ncbi:MAG: hypothetical protein M1816_006218 [Peltula sp. TS41687]|nr:MAG: hypothetical protein M1816_006218 [Peltula sp. TS41687]
MSSIHHANTFSDSLLFWICSALFIPTSRPSILLAFYVPTNVLEVRRLLGLHYKLALWQQLREDIWLRFDTEQVHSRASASREIWSRVLESIERHPAFAPLDNLWHTDDFAMALDVVCRDVARERSGFRRELAGQVMDWELTFQSSACDV